MPDEHDYRDAIQDAERAAASGDFARAEACLRRALTAQELGLGPAHPELASTLNNLAVVCETNGRLGDAEQFYRRACAVATAALPPGDALITTSRANLEDFCRAHGRPVDEWPELGETPLAHPATAAPTAPGPAGALSALAAPHRSTQDPAPASGVTSRPWPAVPPEGGSRGAHGQARETVPGPLRPPGAHAASGAAMRVPPASGASLPRGLVAGLVVLAVVGTGVVAWFAAGPAGPATDVPAASQPASGSAPEAGSAPPGGTTPPAPGVSATPAQTTPVPAAPRATASAAAAPSAPAPPPAPSDARSVPSSTSTGASTASAPRPGRESPDAAGRGTLAVDDGAVRVIDAGVCQPLTRRGGRWTCATPDGPAAAGAVAFFTRVAAPRAVRVEHRWYRDGTLARTVGLSVGASPVEGYRTYSQQTVAPGRWRVEARTPAGRVLHELTFDVRE